MTENRLELSLSHLVQTAQHRPYPCRPRRCLVLSRLKIQNHGWQATPIAAPNLIRPGSHFGSRIAPGVISPLGHFWTPGILCTRKPTRASYLVRSFQCVPALNLEWQLFDIQVPSIIPASLEYKRFEGPETGSRKYPYRVTLYLVFALGNSNRRGPKNVAVRLCRHSPIHLLIHLSFGLIAREKLRRAASACKYMAVDD